MAAIELYSTPLYTDAHIVAYWRMEGNSNDSIDSYNGTDNGISYNSSYGKFGQGALFTAATPSYITVATAAFDFTSASVFSVTMWTKPGSAGNFDLIGKELYQSPWTGWSIGWNLTSNPGILDLYFTDGTYELKKYVQTGAYDGGWHLVTITYDGSALYTGIHIYVDGTEETTVTASSSHALTPSYTGLSFTIGGRDGTHEPIPYGGDTDDVAIFNRVLTATEIFELYNGMSFNIALV